jgi:hypothetical protein
VTVSAAQISEAKAEGMKNVDIAARVANETGNKFYHLLALMEKETTDGSNVYGHDAGGALSGFPKTVNQGNFEVFEWLVFTKSQTSNGVGPLQLTYRGFFADMRGLGLKPWDPYDSITYGGKLWLSYYKLFRAHGFSRDDSIRKAGTKYNGNTAYGDRLLVIMNKWFQIVGNSDYS